MNKLKRLLHRIGFHFGNDTKFIEEEWHGDSRLVHRKCKVCKRTVYTTQEFRRSDGQLMKDMWKLFDKLSRKAKCEVIASTGFLFMDYCMDYEDDEK